MPESTIKLIITIGPRWGLHPYTWTQVCYEMAWNDEYGLDEYCKSWGNLESVVFA